MDVAQCTKQSDHAQFPTPGSCFCTSCATWLKCFFSQAERKELRLLGSVGRMAGVSPYRLPVVSRALVPLPPRGRRKRRRPLMLRPEPSTDTRFYATTGFNEQVLIKVSPLCPWAGLFNPSLACLPRAET